MALIKYCMALAAFALAGPAIDQPVVDIDPPLWVVRDRDTTIWLFGTVHLLKPGLGWFDDAVLTAFEESDMLVLELAPDAQQQASGDLTELGKLSDGPPLPERLPAEYRAKFAAAVTAAGYPADTFDRTAPWLVANTLGTSGIEQAGYRRELGVEPVLIAAAQRQGKTIEGLERATDQYRIFAGLSEDDQIAQLLRVLDSGPTAATGTDAAVVAWSRGDDDGMAEVMADDLKKSPKALAATLIDARNMRWAKWIETRLNRPGTVFMAVGSGHVSGPASVQRALIADGIKVERVRY